MNDLERHTREAYEELAPTGGRLSLRLDSTVVTTEGTSQEEINETFAQTLHAARARELQMGHSLIGPHRDRLEVHLRGRSLRRYGSQGEKRSASIALKLAQGEWLFEHTRERPAVLLDDIFSELDRTRTDALQRRLHREHQLFIATARIDDVIGMRGWDGLKAWSVQDGLLEEIDILDDAVLEAQREALATRNGEA
jgi:DNA replication and repair protein RecF